MRISALVFLLFVTPAWAQGGYDCVVGPSVMVNVGSPIEGVVTEVRAERGAQVRKGEVLAHLERSVEEATLRMAEANAASTVEIDIARSKVDQLEKSVNRALELSSKQVIAVTALETAESELEQARLELRRAEHNQNLAILDRDRAKVQLERRVIRSPVDGIIMRRLIGPGEYVYSQAQVAQIATIDPLNVDVFLPIDLYKGLKVGQTATVKLAAPIGGSYIATITSIDQVFDAASDTFGIQLRLPNPGNRLPAGMDCIIAFDGA